MLPNGTFISGWGAPRSDGRTHQGEDIAAPRGSPIYAPARLYIYSNGWNTYGGWTVSGRDAKGRHWYFAHLNSRSPVPYGRTVYKGQILGYVGTSGNAAGTTPHLHYQVSWPGGGWGNPVYVLQYYPDVP
jgi:murein DD-endopeptidase MepM/ murein hydrolase activator NlpD